MPPLANLKLRRATAADIPTLQRWDHQPHVKSATHDGPNAEADDHDWPYELALQQDGVYEYFIAELGGRPIGMLQVIDPHLEPTHYWGTIEANLRAVDIWIGDPADLGQGHGEHMMRRIYQHCFGDPRVSAIVIDPLHSNTRAHKFYRRLGFAAVGPQTFGDDRCLVHRLERATWRRLFPQD